MNIGKSVVIKGELNGSEDLTIEGQVEGKIELRQNVLTIGPNGRIKAQVFAKAVIILGEVTGNVTATEKVDIRDNGSVDGDIASPRVAIAEGAHFRGSIDMQRSGRQGATRRPSRSRAASRSRSRAAGQPRAPATAGALIGRQRAVASREHRVQADRCRSPRGRPASSPSDPRSSQCCHDLLNGAAKRPADQACLRRDLRAGDEPVIPSKALPKFLSRADASRESPVLIDFGPVIGTNVEFFGERLGCKMFIEDLFAESIGTPEAGRSTRLPERLETRFRHADASVDGILCWDFFDFLDKAVGAGAGAADRSACCGPGGARDGLLLHLGVDRRAASRSTTSSTTTTLRHRPHPASAARSACCRTATSSGCSTGLTVVRIVPAEEQHPRDPAPRSPLRSEPASWCAADYAGTAWLARHRAPDRFRHPRSLRRHDEGRDARDLPRRDARRHHARHRRRTTCSTARSSWPPATGTFPPARSSWSSSIRASGRRGAASPPKPATTGSWRPTTAC